jgi:hypothetical protein
MYIHIYIYMNTFRLYVINDGRLNMKHKLHGLSVNTKPLKGPGVSHQLTLVMSHCFHCFVFRLLQIWKLGLLSDIVKIGWRDPD